jgi:teichuronic acid biosynthesis glycosyltransferase TuaH
LLTVTSLEITKLAPQHINILLAYMDSAYTVKDRDFVVVGLQPWDLSIGSNCKNIALEFSKNNRVLYVNAPLDRNTLLKSKNDAQVQKRIAIRQNKEPQLQQAGDNIWQYYPNCLLESINILPDGFLFDFFNKRNNKKFATEIKKAIAQLGFKDFILFNDSDMFRSFYLKELLQPQKYIYYSRDNLVAVDYWKKHGQRLEPALMQKADAVTANSVYLARVGQKHNPKSYYVGQGCETEQFSADIEHTIPADMQHIAHPRVGYIGALYGLRLDVKLLESIARQRPQWNLVLVGPEDDAFKNSTLHQMPNVFFTGPKKPAELPAYLAGFDVALNPQILSPVTIGNYPRKIDEYLAMGKPSVATKTEAMEIFEGYVYLAENEADYLQMIELALAENDIELKQKRINFAQGHTWQNSVAEIYKAIAKA